MPTTKKNNKSEASKEMRDPKNSTSEKSAAAKELSSGSKKSSK